MRGRWWGGLVVLAGVVGGLPAGEPLPPDGPAMRRQAWLYDTGALRRLPSTRWVERNADAETVYAEVGRCRAFVELLDRDTDRRVRLYADALLVWHPGEGRWRRVHDGRWDDPRKRPLDARLRPDERVHLTARGQAEAFPRLGQAFEVLGPASDEYNCVAWAVGRTDQWIWPPADRVPLTLTTFDAVFAPFGFRRQPGPLQLDRQPGADRIVLYARREPTGGLVPTHAARQEPDGSWSSKVGKLPLIRHRYADDLGGGTYGEPAAVYIRTNQ